MGRAIAMENRSDTTGLSSSAMDRLQRIRRVVRMRLLLFGVLAVASGGVLSFLFVVFVDWMLWLPSVLRIIVSGLFFAGFVAAAWYWILAPLRIPLDLRQIAAQLEARFDCLGDRLISMVDFLQRDRAFDDPLIRRLITTTSQTLQTLPLESALTVRPLVRTGVAFGLAATGLIVVLVALPAWASMGLRRYADPLGPAAWPRTVRIEPITRDINVALGESTSVQMQVVRGFEPGMRAVVHLRAADGHVSTLVMRGDKDGRYRATIDAITSDLTYWYEAGDDVTKDNPSVIHSIRRPAVTNAVARISPPPYAANRPARRQDLFSGTAQATVGGSVLITVRSSKPIPPPTTTHNVGMILQTGELVPMHVRLQDPHEATAEFTVSDDVAFSFLLVDELGFENRGASEHHIESVPDAPPQLTVIEPALLSETTPTGTVRLVVRARDDLGVADVSVATTRASTDQKIEFSLRPHLHPLDAGPDSLVGADYLWPLSESFGTPLLPGDELEFLVFAQDNYVGDEPESHRVASRPFRIQIISDVEFEMRIRDEIAALETRLRTVEVEQVELIDQTETTASSLSTTQDSIHSLAGGQGSIARRVRESADLLEKLADRIQKATDATSRTASDVSNMAQSLNETANENLEPAAEQLRLASDAPDKTGEGLRVALRRQHDGLQQLRAVLRTLGEWGNFRTLTTKSQDILDRQRALTVQTATLGQQLLGKRRESLAPEEEAALRRLRTRQTQLADESEQLLARLESLATESDAEESVAAASESALRAGRASDLVRHAREAGDAVSDNRTAAATIEQRKVEEGLSRIIEALEERDRRELERLQKRLVEVSEMLQQLLQDQTAIRDATIEARLMELDPPTIARLADQQRQMATNTLFVADDLTERDRLADIGGIVKQASEPMNGAVASIQRSELRIAEDDQNAALLLLEEALSLAVEREREAAEELLARTLADIRGALAQMVEVQKELNDGMSRLVQDVRDSGRVTRQEARTASKLARAQVDARDALHAVLPDLEEVMVYRWALRRAVDWMDQCADRLNKRDVDASLPALGERIVNELQMLIDAIDHTRDMPADNEFADGSDGSGGSTGAAGAATAIPTVTELLVLKSMQSDINGRTTTLAKSFDATTATEEQLVELARLGEDQAQIRALTEQVTQRAKGP